MNTESKGPTKLHIVPKRDWIRHEQRCDAHRDQEDWHCVIPGTQLYGAKFDEAVVEPWHELPHNYEEFERIEKWFEYVVACRVKR